ncbi:MAG: aldo/keto reductase [Chitinivibrionales bacterium]|nr:aldo/keto reductase [Chitinivibrionales bacterium]
MRYRSFGRFDWKASALGFGCMRLPTLDGNPLSSAIDENKAISMLHYAFDNGVTYADTAYPYHSGMSEVVLGKALQGGYRQKVQCATKSPVWLVTQPQDFDRLLDEQLKRMNTDHIDFYLLHSLGQRNWEGTVLKFNLLDRMEKARDRGKIGHIGFSFHDKPEAFTTIVDGYGSWEFCQIQYNYMDIESQPGTKGLRYAAEKGLAIIIMEPLLGGRLGAPPIQMQKLFYEEGQKHSPVGWALQWLWDQPQVGMVLSGMSTIEQVKDNIALAQGSSINSFTQQDHHFIEKLRKSYLERAAIGCTRCGYCMPCPAGVNIALNLELYNEGVIHDNFLTPGVTYSRFIDEGMRAKVCTQCKTCDDKCPQKIPISEWMKKIDQKLSVFS